MNNIALFLTARTAKFQGIWSNLLYNYSNHYDKLGIRYLNTCARENAPAIHAHVTRENGLAMVSSLKHTSPKTKYWLRDLGRKFGLEIRLSGINSRDDIRFVNFLHLHHINTVLDVGANIGQFAQSLFAAGYKGRVISIEPLPNAHRKLIQTAQPFGDRWIIGPCLASSNSNGKAKFYVTFADTSSSLLEPLGNFTKANPNVAVDDFIEVETAKLDDLSNDLGLELGRSLLKLDVQGSEMQVLAGARQTLKRLKGLVCEISFSRLYAGQSSAIDVQQFMADEGFEVWDIWRGYSDPVHYRLNQVDALFFNRMFLFTKQVSNPLLFIRGYFHLK